MRRSWTGLAASAQTSAALQGQGRPVGLAAYRRLPGYGVAFAAVLVAGSASLPHAAHVLEADEIWNRACFGGGASPGEGDVALAASLAFHNLVMNGGVLHAFEVLSAEELGRARDGYDWLGRSDVAQFMESTAESVAGTDWDDDDAVDTLEGVADEGYDSLVPDDATLEAAFHARLRERPEAFSAE